MGPIAAKWCQLGTRAQPPGYGADHTEEEPSVWNFQAPSSKTIWPSRVPAIQNPAPPEVPPRFSWRARTFALFPSGETSITGCMIWFTKTEPAGGLRRSGLAHKQAGEVSWRFVQVVAVRADQVLGCVVCFRRGEAALHFRQTSFQVRRVADRRSTSEPERCPSRALPSERLRDTGAAFQSRGCRSGTGRPRTWDRSHKKWSAAGPEETPCWDRARASRSWPSPPRHRRSCAGRSARTESSRRRSA